MSKERRYDSVRIEVCRNCQGAGVTACVTASDNGMRECLPVECYVCGGSGRIRKTLHVVINIEPYSGGK